MAETRTAVDQEPARTVERADQTAATAIHTQATAPLTPPAAAAGQVVETASTPTEFKDRHRTEVTTRTAVDQTQTVAEVRADQTVATTIHTQLATGSLPTTPPTPAAGEIKTLRIEPTEFKDRNRTVAETRTAVSQTRTTAEARGDQTISTTVHTQLATGSLPTTPPTRSAGEIKSVTIEPTEFKDRNRTTETTRTAVKQDTGWISYTNDTGTAYVRTFQNCTLAEVNAIKAGLVTGYRNILYPPRLNEFDLYDGEAIRVPVRVEIDDSTWEGYGEESLAGNTTPLRDHRGRRFFVRIVRTNSAAKALRYAQGAGASDGYTYGDTTADYSITGSYGGHQTGRWNINNGKWLGVRVELNNEDFGIT